MTAIKPPMGWNSWNTFGKDINESLIRQIADTMIEKGYRDAGYEYLIIDDCWSLKERDASGNLVPDPEKFPSGMKALADYVHSKGLKFGMYSCAGILTCAGYPSSYDHEFQDAALFAQWGIDYLKYDYCNFPKNADCINRYQTMSMALKATGRDILFAACNWGSENSWNWMRSIGAHTYRSTGDIFDNFRSFMGIFQSQLEHLCQSGPYCFNDMDMLTVGMYNQGNVAIGKPCTDSEYRMQFSLWCLSGTPLIMGSDIRNMPSQMEDLLLNKELIAINQDIECRPPYLVGKRSVMVPEDDSDEAVEPLRMVKDKLLTFIKHLSNQEFAIAYYNLHEEEQEMHCIFADVGLPYASGYGFDMTDVFTGEHIGVKRDYHVISVPGHDCRLFRCRLVKC
ncbi:glycoside hydrolase family 27 protein [bacterium D16-54]|nr:glycoside hydrolase family 27 protein [bacterium D16-54]RKJ12032.1 glycoside hydrolase family 27 protein [bacterium D16-56]